MSYTHTIRIRYAECDQQGVAFHGHWLAFFDDSCTHFFASLGFDAKELFTSPSGFDMMVVGAELSWHGPAGFDDVVSIEVATARIGTSSFALRYQATVEGRAVCDGTVTYVSIAHGEKRSRPIPDEVRAALSTALIPTDA